MRFQYPKRPTQKPDRSFYKAQYPDLKPVYCYPYLPEHSKVWDMHLRPNQYLIRPYSPKGFTEGGLYVSINDRWARVWGFILATTWPNNFDLYPGDLILFERWRERLIDYDEPKDPTSAGEKQPIAVISERDIIARIEDCTIEFPM